MPYNFIKSIYDMLDFRHHFRTHKQRNLWLSVINTFLPYIYIQIEDIIYPIKELEHYFAIVPHVVVPAINSRRLSVSPPTTASPTSPPRHHKILNTTNEHLLCRRDFHLRVVHRDVIVLKMSHRETHKDYSPVYTHARTSNHINTK